MQNNVKPLHMHNTFLSLINLPGLITHLVIIIKNLNYGMDNFQ